MKKKKKILFATTTRADFGIISEIIEILQTSKQIQTKLLVTGTHLEKKFGHTIKEIKEKKIKNIESIKILRNNFDDFNISKYFSEYTKKTAKIFQKYKPDFFFAIGDRYEMLAISLNALIFRTPIFHLHGGETTLGVIDNKIRDAISKISDFHFVIHKKYKQKLISIGQNEKSIFEFGSPVISKILNKDYTYTKKKLEKILNLKLNEKSYYLVTFHPENLKKNFRNDINLLLKAISLYKNHLFLFTSSNADHSAEIFLKKIKSFCKKKENCLYFESLGQKTYLSLIKYSKGLIGNSSSGVIEAQAFSIPSINIGKRQSGRIFSKSVINIELTLNQFQKAMIKTNNNYFLNNIKNKKPLFYKKNSAKNISKKIIDLMTK